MSIRDLLDDGVTFPAEWKKLAVDSIRARDIEIIPGPTATTSNYAVFSGLKFRGVAGVGASNITGAAVVNADLQLTFVKSTNVWNVSVQCFANGTSIPNYEFHATANGAALITRQALVPAELALSDFINANLFVAGAANGQKILCPIIQFLAGRTLQIGTIIFYKDTTALNTVCRLGGPADYDLLAAVDLMSPFVVSVPVA